MAARPDTLNRALTEVAARQNRPLPMRRTALQPAGAKRAVCVRQDWSPQPVGKNHPNHCSPN
jgi:hypothetical protein